MAGSRHHLLVLGEEVVDIAVQDQTADGLQREDILRPCLGHVQRVEVVPVEWAVRRKVVG